jgi:hypothetical protein
MFSFCANPRCQAPFDYQQGRLFRFHKDHPQAGAPANTHCIQHFWLCGMCSDSYTLEHRTGYGILLRHRWIADDPDTDGFVVVA